MESVKLLLLLSCVKNPGLAAVQQRAQNVHRRQRENRADTYLDFALSLERLKSFNFGLTWSGDRCPLLQL